MPLQDTQRVAATKIQSWIRQRWVQRETVLKKKMVQKRINIAKELLSTEEEYVQNLTILLDNFLKPLQHDQELKEIDYILSKELSSAQSGLEIILVFHSGLLRKIADLIKMWAPYSKLGALFLKEAHYLKSYSQYVNHYQKVVQLLAKRKSDATLQSLLDKYKPNMSGKGIRDYMIMPIQRIPRFEMLLAELIKSTWENHEDFIDLQAAHSTVKNVSRTLENQSADALSIAKVMELANSFIKKDGSSFKLVVPHRRYVSEGKVVTLLSGKTCTAFLFNDILLFAKAKKEKFKLIELVDLDPKAAFVEFQKIPKEKIPSLSTSDLLFIVASKELPNVSQFFVQYDIEQWKVNLESLMLNKKVWLPHQENKSRNSLVCPQKVEITNKESSESAPKKKKKISSLFTSLGRKSGKEAYLLAALQAEDVCKNNPPFSSSRRNNSDPSHPSCPDPFPTRSISDVTTRYRSKEKQQKESELLVATQPMKTNRKKKSRLRASFDFTGKVSSLNRHEKSFSVPKLVFGKESSSPSSPSLSTCSHNEHNIPATSRREKRKKFNLVSTISESSPFLKRKR